MSHKENMKDKEGGINMVMAKIEDVKGHKISTIYDKEIIQRKSLEKA